MSSSAQPTSPTSPTSPVGIYQLTPLSRSPQKPPESNVKIGFWALLPRAGTPSPSDARPIHSTVAWYHSLSNKSIKRLQLHKFGPEPFFIVFITGDGSLFRLKFSSQNKNDQDSKELPAFGIVTPIPDTLDLDPTLWIDIHIYQEGDKMGMDVKFLISVCYGAFATLGQLSLERQSLCALALATSVARKSLPVHERLVGSTETILDEFWRSVSSLSHVVGQSLWEESISEKMRAEVSKWIYRSSRDHIATLLTRRVKTIDQGTNNRTEILSSQRRTAASVVAWLEFLAAKYEVASIAVWDTEWDKAWPKKWDENWEASWSSMTASQILSAHVEFLSSINELIPRLLTTGANGRPSGRMAGRAGIDMAKIAEAVVMPAESLLELLTECRTTGCGVLSGISAADTAAPQDQVDLIEQNCSNWLEAWRLLRHPHSSQKWLPVWEAASNMAWALAWEKAVAQGHQQVVPESFRGATSSNSIVPPKLPSREGTLDTAYNLTRSRHNSTLLPPDNNQRTPTHKVNMQSQESIQSNSSLDLRGLAKGVWFGFEKVLAAAGLNSSTVDFSGPVSRMHRCIAEPDVRMLSEFAWKEAQNNPSSPEANLRTQAQNALDFVKQEANLSSHVIDAFSSQPQGKGSIWERNFIKTWEETWKQCWEVAWVKVMENTIDKFWERGFEEGRSSIGNATSPFQTADPANNLLEGAHPSYENLKSYICSGTSLEDCYWRIHSMFKALGLLHKALDHSIPTSHEGAMKIQRFSERAPMMVAPGRASRRGRDSDERFAHKPLAHGDFQKEIKDLVKKHCNRKEHDGNLNSMKLIWALAIAANNNPTLMDSKDPEAHELFQPIYQTQSDPAEKGQLLERWRAAARALIKSKRLSPRRRQSTRGEPFGAAAPAIDPSVVSDVALGSSSAQPN